MTVHDLGETFSVSEIAAALSIRPSAVTNWRRRHSSFPPAIIVDTEERFAISAVAEWLKSRKIRRPDLLPHEPLGTTYLHRLHRSDADEDLSESAIDAELEQRLYAASNILRGDHLRAGDICQLVLAIFWCLSKKPELRRQSDGSWSLPLEHFTGFEIPIDHHQTLPLFPARTWGMITEATLTKCLHTLEPSVREDSHPSADLLTSYVEQILSDGREEHITPSALADLMAALAEPKTGDRVLDPFPRASELLVKVAIQAGRKGRGTTLQGRAATEEALRLSFLVASLSGIGVDLRSSRLLQYVEADEGAYDVIVANPPFNLKYGDLGPSDPRWRYGVPPASNMNFAWLQSALFSLRPNGRVALLAANNTVQSRSPAERSIRRRMVADGAVEAVVALPNGLFATTAIPTCLWLLRNPRGARDTEVLFIDATSKGTVERRGRRTLARSEIAAMINEVRRWRARSPDSSFASTKGFSASRTTAELLEGDTNLNPRVQVDPAHNQVDHEELRRRAAVALHGLDAAREDARDRSTNVEYGLRSLVLHDSKMNTDTSNIPLGNFCDVLSGPGNIKTADDEDSIAVVTPRGIAHHVVSLEGALFAPSSARDDLRRYRLFPGDIVGSRSGSVGRFGVFRHNFECFLGSGCLRIRPQLDRIDPVFLTYFLSAESTQDWIDRRAAGSMLATINADSMRELPLVLPPINEQRRIGELLLALDAEASASESAARASTAVASALTEALISGAADLRRHVG